MKCCNNIEKLGCFNSCNEVIETELTATEFGSWTIEIDFMGITQKQTMVIEESESPKAINIVNNFNEDYEYTMRIYTPSNVLLNNTCYSFKTYKTVCN